MQDSSSTWQFLNEGDSVEIIAPSCAPINAEQIDEAKKLISVRNKEKIFSCSNNIIYVNKTKVLFSVEF